MTYKHRFLFIGSIIFLPLFNLVLCIFSSFAWIQKKKRIKCNMPNVMMYYLNNVKYENKLKLKLKS